MRGLCRFLPIGSVAILLFLSGCGPGQLFGPTFTPTPSDTPTPTSTPTPTLTPTLTQTLTPTITPTPIPGIEAPIMVEGIGILFTDAQLTDYYTLGGNQSYTPTLSSDTFLVVVMNVPEDYMDAAEDVEFSAWDVTVNDEFHFTFLSTQTGLINSQRQCILTWVYVVPEGEARYILNFPGGIDFDLEPLL
ncbi:MAG: hypothetical protein JW929_04145 [Anaerolineales bacterium]|nr:hypothetical protein [Anaerolineales bacterium]